MNLVEILRRITGVSTPLGGISWAEQKPRIPKFEGVVNLTWNENRPFLDFLSANAGKTVGLNVEIDASISVPSQEDFLNESPDAFARIHDCELSGVAIPLPNDTGMCVWLTFNLLNARRLMPSHGGTGIFQMSLKGIFEVVRTAHGGPSSHFHITEEEADVEFRLAVFGG
jgi:hypothetical protein